MIHRFVLPAKILNSPNLTRNKKTYIFPVTLESDEEGWRAVSPSLESMGASIWGETREEALKNIREVLAAMLEEFLDEGMDIVEQGIAATEGAVITITRRVALIAAACEDIPPT